MKIFILTTFITLLVLSMTGCEKKVDKYLNEKQTLEYLIKITINFSNEIEASTNRIAIGRSIVKFITEIKRIKTKMYELEKICPEFKTTYGYKNAPKELQSLIKQLGESLALLKIIIEGKAAKYNQDKNVVKMFQELKEILFYY
jgi:hypothetical protein